MKNFQSIRRDCVESFLQSIVINYFFHKATARHQRKMRERKLRKSAGRLKR